ncbi:hypothetical protein HHI36_017238, partial [Cryptolaemus montrouzieri]
EKLQRRGVLIAVINGHKALPIRELHIFNVEKVTEVSGVFLPHSKLVILTTYRSPSGSFDNYLNSMGEILLFIA